MMQSRTNESRRREANAGIVKYEFLHESICRRGRVIEIGASEVETGSERSFGNGGIGSDCSDSVVIDFVVGISAACAGLTRSRENRRGIDSAAGVGPFVDVGESNPNAGAVRIVNEVSNEVEYDEVDEVGRVSNAIDSSIDPIRYRDDRRVADEILRIDDAHKAMRADDGLSDRDPKCTAGSRQWI